MKYHIKYLLDASNLDSEFISKAYMSIAKPRGMRSEDLLELRNDDKLSTICYEIKDVKHSAQDISHLQFEFKNYFAINLSAESAKRIQNFIDENHYKISSNKDVKYGDTSDEARLARLVLSKFGNVSSKEFKSKAFEIGTERGFAREVISACINLYT